RLVEDDDPDAGEVERPALDVIEEPPGRAHDDRRAALERTLLRPVGDAAVDRGLARVPIATDRAELTRHLERELARGHDDEGLRPLERCIHSLEDRDRERGGLAGPGLRLGEQVPPLLEDGDRALLNG